jgi:hypothetical protein
MDIIAQSFLVYVRVSDMVLFAFMRFLCQILWLLSDFTLPGCSMISTDRESEFAVVEEAIGTSKFWIQ